MRNFPVSNLTPQDAMLRQGASGKPKIEIKFAPFDLINTVGEDIEPLHFDGYLIVESIELPSSNPSMLENQSFAFPANPKDGYVDGYIYFTDVYTPVSITKITFAHISNNETQATITSRWLMSYEMTGFEDFDYTFSVIISH